MSFMLFMTGVPLSTQWGPQGYFYPIQISQYGLSHYSKFAVEKEPQRSTYGLSRDHHPAVSLDRGAHSP